MLYFLGWVLMFSLKNLKVRASYEIVQKESKIFFHIGGCNLIGEILRCEKTSTSFGRRFMRRNLIRWTFVVLTAVGCNRNEPIEERAQEKDENWDQEERQGPEEVSHHQSQTKQRQRTSFNETKSSPRKSAAKLTIEKEGYINYQN